MPAWIAGIQVRQEASGDIHVNLMVPALYAGMTQSRVLLELTEVLRSHFQGAYESCGSYL